MKKAIHIYLSLLLCMATGIVSPGCTDDLSQYFPDNGNATVTATIEGDVSARTIYADDDTRVKVSWAQGDYITLFKKDTDQVYKYFTRQGGESADFRPEGKEMTLTDGETIHAIYPNYYNPKVSGNSIQVYGNFTQDVDRGLATHDFMCATGTVKSGKVNLRFRHLMAVIRVTLNTELLREAAGKSDEVLLIMRNSKHDISASATDSSNLTYNFDTDAFEGGERYPYTWIRIRSDEIKSETITFYTAVLPCEAGGTITLSLQGKDPMISRDVPAAGLKAGHVYRMGVDTDEGIEKEMKLREILTEFYYSTNGPSWTKSDNWCTDAPLKDWYGLYFSNGNLIMLDLYSNNLNGTLPESIGDLQGLQYLNLGYNNLSGPLPESLGNMTDLKFLSLELNNFTGVIPESWKNLEQLSWLYLYGNTLSGKLSDNLVNSTAWTSCWALEYIVYQKPGYLLDFGAYHSSDYSLDRKVETISTHTRGNGIPLLIISEGYTDRLLSEGAFQHDAENILDDFFSVEPYASNRDLFDIHLVNIVSQTEWIGYGTAFNTSYELGRLTMKMDYNQVKELVSSLSQTNYTSDDVTAMILMPHNCPFRAVCYMYSNRFAAGITLDTHSAIHEIGGHGFGKLGDEYVEYSGYYNESLSGKHARGEYMNVDTKSSPTEVIWHDLLANPDYTVEKLGVYEGALYYPHGAYRSSESSIMNAGNKYPIEFNAPSRRAIYKRMMTLSGLGYSENEFLEYDKLNLEKIKQGAIPESLKNPVKKDPMNQEKILMGAPPVFVN